MTSLPDSKKADTSEAARPIFSESLSTEDREHNDAFVTVSYESYISGYLRAADTVIDSASHSQEYVDDLFFPVALLYRHFIELSLKRLIRTMNSECLCNYDEVVLGKHNLGHLWNIIKQAIVASGLDEDAGQIVIVDGIIRQFDQFDTNGQAFRYPSGKKGERHLALLPKSIDLANLQRSVRIVADYIEQVHIALDVTC